jgi:hypothetical protein
MMLPKTISNFAGILDMPYEQVNYISKDIGKLNTYGKLAVTDAGKLPYYSKWYTVDLFGLNTPEMAKSMVQPGFVDQYQPDLIELYAYPQDYSFMEDRNKITPVTKKDWYGIALNIYKGCDSNKYEPYLVPFYCRKISEVKENLSFLDNAFEYFFNIRNSFNTKTSLEGYYNLYIIRKDYEHYKELKQILLKYSGKSYQEYKRIMSYE